MLTEESVSIAKFKLPNGYEMPRIGFGTFKIDKKDTKEVIKNAVKIGYRLIDCAMIYLNEKEIGDAIRELIQEKVVTRDELFITSKLWNCYHKKEHVEEAVDKTLLDLGLEYLDLYLIHSPLSFHYHPFDKNTKGFDEQFDPFLKHVDLSQMGGTKINRVPIYETYQAMEELVIKKKVRSIGVSNFNVALINDLLSYARIKPVVNQVESHIYLQQPQLRKFLQSNDIVVQTFANLGSGGGLLKEQQNNFPVLLEDKLVLEISENLKKTPAQICLKFMLDLGCFIIPKSSNVTRMTQNLDLDFHLGDDNFNQLLKLDRNFRFYAPHLVPYFD